MMRARPVRAFLATTMAASALWALRPARLSAQSTTPPAGDTVGYWQQRADYTIAAQLHETRGVLVARGTLRYVNASPDTLRELWLHQHLNAFRPGSRWSANDSAQGRTRFQRLRDPDYGYERFTAVPRVNGRAVRAEYPLAPDSTVVRLRLPRALPPGGTLRVQLAWEARPSTVLRRQGRRGRHYDFAQWYPKVAVYDREGWHPNAFVPQGELYGEFGTFDVTLRLPRDQVVASSGVPAGGDPGWARVRLPVSELSGSELVVRAASAARVGTPTERVPAGYRAVRFVATGVHHFGFSVSPHYRYEGSRWLRAPHDTVLLHVLHEDWTPGRTMGDLRHALGWLEGLYGPYTWPQLTIAQRLEASGTEFPMLVMNGEEDRSLVVHEAGHQFTYGLLANNEWRHAWLDEGFTTYQERWERGEARVPLALERERAGAAGADTAELSPSLRARVRAADAFTAAIDTVAAPVGLTSDRFATKDLYDLAVYDRAAAMYSALHDLLGDTGFRTLLRRYAATWRGRHVDPLALQRAAEAVARERGAGDRAHVTGGSLDWFFGQWTTRTGTIDYRLDSLQVTPPAQAGDGWTVEVQLRRLGVYSHPMPIGVKTPSGWTVVRGQAGPERQRVRVLVRERPLEVRLDPFGFVESRTTAASRVSVP